VDLAGEGNASRMMDTWEQDAMDVYRARMEAFYGEEPQVTEFNIV
jgi:hypothetical protein